MKWFNSIRSVATFLLVTTSCIGFIMGRISGEQFFTMVMMAMTFYFGMKDRSKTVPPLEDDGKVKVKRIQLEDLNV